MLHLVQPLINMGVFFFKPFHNVIWKLFFNLVYLAAWGKGRLSEDCKMEGKELTWVLLTTRGFTDQEGEKVWKIKSGHSSWGRIIGLENQIVLSTPSRSIRLLFSTKIFSADTTHEPWLRDICDKHLVSRENYYLNRDKNLFLCFFTRNDFLESFGVFPLKKKKSY